MAMDRGLLHFLLIYDGAQGRLRHLREFAQHQREAAVAAYEEAEKRYTTDDNVQVVLIAADSLETVQRTHSNFWHGESIEVLLRDALATS